MPPLDVSPLIHLAADASGIGYKLTVIILMMGTLAGLASLFLLAIFKRGSTASTGDNDVQTKGYDPHE